MKRLLVIGGSGFLGLRILEMFRDRYECYGTYFKNPVEIDKVRMVKLNLLNDNEVKLILGSIEPDLIIFTAKFDKKNEDAQTQKQVFKILVKNVKCRFVLISTDAIFDGKEGMYKEEDKTNPITPYGKGKLIQEDVVKKNLKDYAIIRTCYIYGSNSKGYDSRIDEITKSFRKGKKMEWHDNVFKSPVFVDDLAGFIVRIAENDFVGVLNVAGERMSVYEFASNIVNALGLDDSMLEVTSKEESNDTSLDISKAKELGFEPTSMDDALI